MYKNQTFFEMYFDSGGVALEEFIGGLAFSHGLEMFVESFLYNPV